jgi:hypothetical protein
MGLGMSKKCSTSKVLCEQIFVVVFCSTGDGIQGLVFAGQVLYHFSHTSNLFCLSYFSNSVLNFRLELPQTVILLLLSPM